MRNGAALIREGTVISKVYKSLLPSYDVFDESRYFQPAEAIKGCSFLGKRLGITICEDIWNDKDYGLPKIRYI